MQRSSFFVVYQSYYTSQDKKGIMSSKNSKKSTKTWQLVWELKTILFDILFAYKNFVHWNISKILISFWSFTLWIILSLPVFISAIIIGMLDPIEWSEIAAYLLSWSDVSYQLVWGIALHPYNLVFMVFLWVVGLFLFLLWSSYSLFLKAELSLGYVKWKKLKYRKNHYFNRWFIFRYIWIMSWNIVYIIAPIIIWVWVVFFMYLFYNIWFITFNVLSILIAIHTVILLLAELYLIYRLVFWYIILADDAQKKHLESSISYVRKSIEITKWSSFFKFLGLYFVYILLIAPFTLFDGYLENQSSSIKDAIIYNSWLLQNLEPDEIQYYEFISKEYSDLTSEELNSRLQSFATLRIILYFISYLTISGIFVLVLTSFYKRVLLGK